MSAQPPHDVAICGGGLVGATLAIALAQLDLKVALFESHPFGAIDQPSFDERTTALSNGSRRVFEGLGIWPLIEREATPIRRIHVSDKGRFGFARIDANEQGLDQLGHVVVNRTIGAALWRRLQESNVQIVAPAQVTSVELAGDHRRVVCERSDNMPISIAARLVVAADGARSIARESAGIAASNWDYEQTALVTNVVTQRFHDYVAYERFTESGPIAILPMSDGRSGVIWTLAPALAREVLALNDQEFIAHFQQAFGFRLGRFTKVGKRQTYPLALTRSEAHTAERLAVIGNAAQALHPIAGQGFNLGLRDVASLAEVLADARQANTSAFDAGDGVLLQRYCSWREDDRREIVRFTDGLVRLFTQPFGPIKLLRDLGLLAFDLMPPAKSAMAQLSLGAAGKVPRLARGASLVLRS
jgi:2-octaprenyl-6-methoxyphenol hydroxylase